MWRRSVLWRSQSSQSEACCAVSSHLVSYRPVSCRTVLCHPLCLPRLVYRILPRLLYRILPRLLHQILPRLLYRILLAITGRHAHPFPLPYYVLELLWSFKLNLEGSPVQPAFGLDCQGLWAAATSPTSPPQEHSSAGRSGTTLQSNGQGGVVV